MSDYEQVTTVQWKAKDGTLHPTLERAKTHDRWAWESRWESKLSDLAFAHNNGLTADESKEITDFIFNNWGDIAKLMADRAADKP